MADNVDPFAQQGAAAPQPGSIPLGGAPAGAPEPPQAQPSVGPAGAEAGQQSVPMAPTGSPYFYGSPSAPAGGRPPRPPQWPLPPAAARTKRRGMWAALLLMLFLVGGLVVLVTVLVVAAMGPGGVGSWSAAGKQFREETISGQGQDKIAVIEIKGVISESAGFGGGPGMAERTVRMLRQAANDSDVKAVVLAVDSPGGGVTASDVICNEVQAVKRANKKVIVHMGDLCASGGYYISAPADWIIASPTTITGSIGVIITHLDASELLEKKLGIKMDPIKSGPHKDIMSMGRPMKDEERAILQALITDIYDRFVKIVVDGRMGKGSLPADQKAADAAVRKLADGRVYIANEAVKNGLADETGYREHAYQKAKELAGLSEATVVRYYRRIGLMEALAGDADGKFNINTGLQIEAGELLRESAPRFEYRWAPNW